ncbi:hypothetical protein F4703DRAFT_1912033 [Phycomyces blakesleeanus]
MALMIHITGLVLYFPSLELVSDIRIAQPLKPVYIRLRREKTNLFLCIDPKDTMTDVKVKLCGALKLDKTPDNIRLLMPTQWDNKYDLLEDAWTMSKANLSNDALVYFVFFDSNRGSTNKQSINTTLCPLICFGTVGNWEDVQLIEPEPLDDPEDDDVDMRDNLAAIRKEKGKEKSREKGKGRA